MATSKTTIHVKSFNVDKKPRKCWQLSEHIEKGVSNVLMLMKPQNCNNGSYHSIPHMAHPAQPGVSS